MKNIRWKIIGVILILLPFLAIATLIITDKPVPVIGSPVIMIILWCIGGTLLFYKGKWKL